MWVFSESGFTSIVRHRDVPELLLVRARDRASLVAFCEEARIAESEIVELERADYPFRVSCSERAVLRWLRTSVEELDYDNFKARVSRSRGKSWHDALLDVWRRCDAWRSERDDRRPARQGDRVWVPGHSPMSGRVGQLERQLEILEVVPVRLTRGGDRSEPRQVPSAELPGANSLLRESESCRSSRRTLSRQRTS